MQQPKFRIPELERQMSEDEKPCQIGMAVLALQRAREDLALIEGKLDQFYPPIVQPLTLRRVAI